MTSSEDSQTTRFEPASGPLGGSILCPADKSISHRSALLAAMSSGRTRIERYLLGEDTLSTLAAMQALGAGVQRDGDTVVVDGVGLRGLRSPSGVIDVGNAGTLMRLLIGWLAGLPGLEATLDGDDSIRSRPMARVLDPLREMGADVSAAREGKYAPLQVRGRQLTGIEYLLPMASAQVKSCVLLAGLVADGETTVIEPVASRDHTERMLAAAGAELTRDGDRIRVRPAQTIELGDQRIPGDPSSAAFPIAAALLVPGSEVTVREVSTNWTRGGFVEIARRMGAQIEGAIEAPGTPHTVAETTTDYVVRHSELRGTVVEPHEVPLAVDELPLVGLLGCFAAPGEKTIVRGAEEMRVKEVDRIAAVCEELGALGGQLEPTDDGFIVTGTGGLRGGTLDSRGDHRMAMIGAVAGLASQQGVDVIDMGAADVSYPDFATHLETLAAAG